MENLQKVYLGTLGACILAGAGVVSPNILDRFEQDRVHDDLIEVVESHPNSVPDPYGNDTISLSVFREDTGEKYSISLFGGEYDYFSDDGSFFKYTKKDSIRFDRAKKRPLINYGIHTSITSLSLEIGGYGSEEEAYEDLRQLVELIKETPVEMNPEVRELVDLVKTHPKVFREDKSNYWSGDHYTLKVSLPSGEDYLIRYIDENRVGEVETQDYFVLIDGSYNHEWSITDRGLDAFPPVSIGERGSWSFDEEKSVEEINSFYLEKVGEILSVLKEEDHSVNPDVVRLCELIKNHPRVDEDSRSVWGYKNSESQRNPVYSIGLKTPEEHYLLYYNDFGTLITYDREKKENVFEEKGSSSGLLSMTSYIYSEDSYYIVDDDGLNGLSGNNPATERDRGDFDISESQNEIYLERVRYLVEVLENEDRNIHPNILELVDIIKTNPNVEIDEQESSFSFPRGSLKYSLSHDASGIEYIYVDVNPTEENSVSPEDYLRIIFPDGEVPRVLNDHGLDGFSGPNIMEADWCGENPYYTDPCTREDADRIYLTKVQEGVKSFEGEE